MNYCSRFLWLSLSLGTLTPLAAEELSSRQGAVREAVSDRPGTPPPVAKDVAALVALLDSPQFGTRAGATEQLAAQGPAVIPHLVELLGDRSAEVRFRATMLLMRHHSFEDVAPPLLAAMDQPHGSWARMVLRERALQQVEAACQLPHAERLFKFWGTDLDRYRASSNATRRSDQCRADRAGHRTALPAG